MTVQMHNKLPHNLLTDCNKSPKYCFTVFFSAKNTSLEEFKNSSEKTYETSLPQ